MPSALRSRAGRARAECWGGRIGYVQSRSAHDVMNRHSPKNRSAEVSGALAYNPGLDVDVSIFVTALDGLSLHVRKYGSHVASALPVVCLPGLARTAADFHLL